MLELILVIPLLLLLLLSVLQLAEIIAASLATEWAGRHASRAAGVHVAQADDVARRVAIRILGPFLPPVPGVETTLNVGNSPVLERIGESVDAARAGMADAGSALDTIHGALEDVTGGVGTEALQRYHDGQERLGGATHAVRNHDLANVSTPATLTEWSRRLEPKWRWMLRAQFYERLASEADESGDDTFDPLYDGLGMDLHPVSVETVVRGLRGGGARASELSGDEALDGMARHRGVGEVQVTVRFRFPLRFPLANLLFADSRRSPLHRTIERTSRYPVMYAPAPE